MADHGVRLLHILIKTVLRKLFPGVDIAGKKYGPILSPEGLHLAIFRRQDSGLSGLKIIPVQPVPDLIDDPHAVAPEGDLVKDLIVLFLFIIMFMDQAVQDPVLAPDLSGALGKGPAKLGLASGNGNPVKQSFSLPVFFPVSHKEKLLPVLPGKALLLFSTGQLPDGPVFHIHHLKPGIVAVFLPIRLRHHKGPEAAIWRQLEPGRHLLVNKILDLCSHADSSHTYGIKKQASAAFPPESLHFLLVCSFYFS